MTPALWVLAGMGVAALMARAWHMAVMARAYVSDRFNAWKAYDKECDAHRETERRLREAESALGRAGALCGNFGFDPQLATLHEWLDQRFAGHRAEARDLRSQVSARDRTIALLRDPAKSLEDIRARFLEQERVVLERATPGTPATLRAHLAEQDSKDKPS